MNNLYIRRLGTNRIGIDFDAVTTQAVWNKGRPVPGRDSELWRFDCCGALVYRWSYGDRKAGGFGWEIDHIQPVAKGGTDALSNLQPLQWENNSGKSDDWPIWSCKVSLKQ